MRDFFGSLPARSAPAQAQTAGDRAAWRLFALHAAIIVFSTVALTTFLAGPPPEWMTHGINATIATWGFRLSGPTYVVCGALATLAHAAGRIGPRRASLLFVAGYALSLTSELIGTSTGWPFGPYAYTSMLGYRIAGLVPFPIPLSWFFMLYGVIAICGRVLPARDGWRTVALWAVVGGVVLTAWDVSMDPAMSFATTHWIWKVPGAFYGMPWLNWFGWWLTGSAIVAVYLTIVPPSMVARAISPSAFGIVIYAVNGIMPVAICLRHGLLGAWILGALAMAVPVVLALRASTLQSVDVLSSRQTLPRKPAVHRAVTR